MIENGESQRTTGRRRGKGGRDGKEVDPAQAGKEDLFGYGVAAKISGVEGRGTGEFALLVEGVARVRVERIVEGREGGFLEGECVYLYDEGKKDSLLLLFWDMVGDGMVGYMMYLCTDSGHSGII